MFIVRTKWEKRERKERFDAGKVVKKCGAFLLECAAKSVVEFLGFRVKKKNSDLGTSLFSQLHAWNYNFALTIVK